ncbi:hypothetical protein UlMin_019099 [Ulmus minor]
MVRVKQLEDEILLEKCAMPKRSKFSQSFRGARVPLYCFGSQSLGGHGCLGGILCNSEDEQSMLDALLLAQWEDRMAKGIFRYDVTNSEIKVIGGKKTFLAQLNEGSSLDHLPKLAEDKICHQGDVFEFNSVEHHKELLFCVTSSEKSNPELILSAPLPDCGTLIFANASPVEYGHVFLVPCALNSFYQFLDASFLEMAVRVAVEINNGCFRLFYNYSPDVSHLYFQACYFPNPLAVELMPVDVIFGNMRGGLCVSVVKEYPIKTLIFKSTQNLKIMTEVLVETCSCLQEKCISYNLLISDCGKKIFLFLQQKLKNSCSLSAWECGGYFLFKSRSEFNQVTEKAMLKRLSTSSLDDEGFEAVKLLCCSIASKFAI